MTVPRRPTVRETAWFFLATRKRRPHRLSATERHLTTFSASIAIAMGRPAPPPPPDPLRCACGHSVGRHTNRPRGFGCLECLCLTIPTLTLGDL